MKAAARHVLLVGMITAILFFIAMRLAPWLGAKEWRLFGVDAWLVLDRATILSSFVFTASALYGIRRGGWVRRLFAQRSFQPNESTEKILQDTRVLIMLYYNSEAANQIVDLFGPRIDMLFLVTSTAGQDKASKHSDAERFLEEVKGRFGHIQCGPTTYVADKNDLQEARRAVLSAIDRAETRVRYGAHPAGKITCDLTGASKPMSFGMLEAAKERGLLAVYTDAARNADDTVVSKTQRLITIVPRASAPAS